MYLVICFGSGLIARKFDSVKDEECLGMIEEFTLEGTPVICVDDLDELSLLGLDSSSISIAEGE